MVDKKGLVALVACVFTLLTWQPSAAQSIQELQSQKEQALARIANSNKLILETSKNQSLSLQKLNLIKAKIDSRNELIENLGKQEQHYGKAIERKEREIRRLENEIEELKVQYASFLRQAQFSSHGAGLLLHLLASRSVGQLYRRIRFYREYVAYQSEQYQNITHRDSLLKLEMDTLREDRERLLQLRKEESASREHMEQEKAQYYEELGRLMKEERKLKAQVLADEQRIEKINSALRKLLEDEAKRNESRKKDAEYLKLSSTFSEHRGRLPWPILDGVISRGFGEANSKLFKHVKTVSQGVDIIGPKRARVRAVFPGVVSKIAHIPGGNDVVIIRHGDYLTLYSNLEGVTVHVGEVVRRNEEIGKVFGEKGKTQSMLHFEIWKGFKAQNPKKWLRR